MRGAAALLAALLVSCLSACGNAPANSRTGAVAQLRTVGLVSGGHRRSYLLYVPSGDSPRHRLPLVLVFHGALQTASIAASQSGLLRIDQRRHDMILAFLQGYRDTWNEGAGATPAAQAGINDVAFTASVLRRIESRHYVDPQRVVATGFSNGALLTELLGCRLASQITLIAPVEGQLPTSVADGCSPAAAESVYEVHATADPTIPYGGGWFDGVGGGTSVLSAPASAARWAALDHCSAQPQSSGSGSLSLSSYGGCKDGVTVTLATIEGGQHQWPNGFGATLVKAIGSLPAGRRIAAPG